MKKYTMVLLLLIIFLGIFYSSMNKNREGLDDEPTISADDAKALAGSFKSQMAAAGIPQGKAFQDQTSALFDQLFSLVNQEVNATNNNAEARALRGATDDENNMPTVNTVTPPIPFPDTTFFVGSKFGDAFCLVDNPNPTALNQKCSTLTADNCNATDCCVWVNGTKCVAGNAGGPTYINGTKLDADYYSYKYQCYGNCGSSPPASSCHGWDCNVEKQRCLSGTPGAGNSNWTCVNKKWVEDK